MRRMSPPEPEIGTVRFAGADFQEMGAYMKRIIAFGIVALAITACGDDRTAAPASVSEAVVTTPEAAPVPSTTVAAPTPTTTEPMPTTTLPETTTTVATEDLIKQAVQDFIATIITCGLAPADCVTRRPSLPRRATHAQRSTTLPREWLTTGFVFSTDLRGSYLVARISRSDVGLDSHGCVLLRMTRGSSSVRSGPDGVPTVVNDEVSSIAILNTACFSRKALGVSASKWSSKCSDEGEPVSVRLIPLAVVIALLGASVAHADRFEWRRQRRIRLAVVRLRSLLGSSGLSTVA